MHEARGYAPPIGQVRTYQAGVPMLQLKCCTSSTLKSAEHVNKISSHLYRHLMVLIVRVDFN